MTETGQSSHPEATGSPHVPPLNRPVADDRRESGELGPPPARPRPVPIRLAPLSAGTGPGKGMNFTLQKSTFAGLIGGLLVIAVLIFIGGFLSGVRFILSTPPARMESPPSPATAPVDIVTPVLPAAGPTPKEAGETPKEVNTLTGHLPQQVATGGTAPEPQSAAKTATAPATSAIASTSPAPPKANSAPPSQQLLPQTGHEAPPAAETADNLPIEPPPVPLLLQPAPKAGDKPAPASVTVRVNPLTGPLPLPRSSDQNQWLFTLQAGAFLDKRGADRVSAELQDRGYTVKVLKTVDTGQREWFRVRIGHYTALEQATAAARTFQEKERIPVEVVRQPAGPPQK